MQLTRTLLVSLIVALIGVSAAHAADPCPPIKDGVAPVRSFSVHTSGGIAGFDDWVVVGLDGRVCVYSRGPGHTANKLSPAQLSALKQAFKTSGFFGWKPLYRASRTIPDGMTTTLVYDDGKKRYQVSVSDGAPGPPGFSKLALQVKDAANPPYSHAGNYAWVYGKVQYSPVEGGTWTLFYQKKGAPSDKSDKYGGKFVLLFNGKPPAWLKSGQMVKVMGDVKEDTMGIHMAGSYYNVRVIEQQ